MNVVIANNVNRKLDNMFKTNGYYLKVKNIKNLVNRTVYI